MVQRKLPTKLTLQLSDHAKPHHHDLKSPRGADLKAKKMKKSGSVKRPKLLPPSTPPPRPLCKTTPNYMKSTTSSNARKEQLQRNSSLKDARKEQLGKRAAKTAARTLTKNPGFEPARTAAARKCNPVVVTCEETVDAKRATCSSTLKDCKFPAFLSLYPEGTSAVKVCPYTYCSLNGHHHPPLPPLKTFISARRRAVKSQRRAPPVEEDDDDDFNKRRITREEKESNDFFLEICAAAENQEVLVEEERKEELATNIVDFYEQDSSDGSDMEWEIGYGSPSRFDYDYGSSNEKQHMEPDPEEADVVINFKEGKEFCSDDLLMDEELASQESFDEDGFSSDAFSSSDDGDSTCLYDDDDDMQNSSTIKTSSPLQVSMEEEEEEEEEEEYEGKNILFDQTSNQEYEASSLGDLNHEYPPIKEVENGGEAEMEGIALLRYAGSSKKKAVEHDEVGGFNPRAPNFLPLEADPEAERVDLRHQDLEERKNSEEWMMDYALRQVVTKLGPARKRKVALLVEAFEKVMPTATFDLQFSHVSAFDQPRQMQACI